MIEGFTRATIAVGESAYAVGTRGEGPPVLLLHGFPQTHHCWRHVAPALAAEHTVVVCDLKGVGESRAPAGGPLGEGYGKRELAVELVDAMGQMGHERFAVVGHDRGARVAYRMALDHPATVQRLAVLNIVPTVDQFERMAAAPAPDYYPWFLLAEPAPFPERLLAASAELFIRHTIGSWAETEIDAGPYVRAFTPETISAWCSEYRAALHVDRQMDADDREAGRRIACPVLVHTEAALSDALETWRTWADDVQGGPLPSGHFIPEEAAEPLAASLRGFLA